MTSFIQFKNTLLLALFITLSCGELQKKSTTLNLPVMNTLNTKTLPVVGANRTDQYLAIIQNKPVGIVTNQTGVLYNSKGQLVHLVDTLVALKRDIQKVFAPEHGFRGTADAGEAIKDGVDGKTGLPVISLYGANKKPTPEQLSNIEVMLFDIQDVGARFYTYISTLHYVMEACAEARIPLIILDRPNPNGHYVDGPVLEEPYKSFVGMHPVPIVHGMTVGEYAQMINGERWLANGAVCEITVILVKNYDHTTPYSLPVKPSPNLPNDVAVSLYPSLCLFEGTNVSVGRGTDMPFQVYGSPFLPNEGFSFIPFPREGAKEPLYQGKRCYGANLSATPRVANIELQWLISAYNHTADKATFFNSFFTKLAGTKTLQQQIEAGATEETIRKSWENGLQKFKKMRERYRLYD